MKRCIFTLILAFSLLITGCGQKTPDPCSPENLPAEAARVNKLMREFDDYSSLASNTPQTQLVVIVPEMQRILRDAEDQVVPACVQDLKKMQLAHMNIVVQTLMAFMSSSDANLDLVNAGIAQARQLHAQYDIEMARLLGVTLAAPPTGTPAGAVPESNTLPPTGTPVGAVPESNTLPPTATLQSAAQVTNPGPNGVNLRAAPNISAAESGTLAVLASATAIGRSADEQWIQVEIPGQPGQVAWVYASLVQLSVPIAQLPVIDQ